jgi:hypothetical protein
MRQFTGNLPYSIPPYSSPIQNSVVGQDEAGERLIVGIAAA